MSKDINKGIGEFTDFIPTEDQINKFEELANAYSDKSEDDFFVEIIRVNEQMEQEMSKEEYEELFEKLNSIRPLLNEEQSEKLDRILDVLGR